MSTRESISCFSRHGSPAIDYSDLPELQCACHEPKMRHIYYTENDVRLCFLKCNVSEDCSLSIREDLLKKYAKEMVNYCTMASSNSLHDALASSVHLLNEKAHQI
ncbi:hypothetical protein QYE76_003910 [Lolium multiflorum]|uniref:Uncharacterized protein n=1 Tax=Lolium multiflorum TaxID=4521 RepID=A0AAD8VZ99_LOLMU|nr:hypothetical protein QYE76_003910 [Lolium multiflorum]